MWLTPIILGTREAEIRKIGKPAQANSSRDPVSKKPFTKKGWWSGPEFKP
jgi:hypothetical protein